jgi:hypothetical protein
MIDRAAMSYVLVQFGCKEEALQVVGSADPGFDGACDGRSIEGAVDLDQINVGSNESKIVLCARRVYVSVPVRIRPSRDAAAYVGVRLFQIFPALYCTCVL